MQDIVVEKSNKYVTKRERRPTKHVGGYGDR